MVKMSSRRVGLLRLLLVLAVASCLAPLPAVGQPAPGEEKPARSASAAQSAAKATTYKLGTALTNLAIFSAGTGVFGGVVLTTFVTIESWLVYGVNDYLWDAYSPKSAPKSDGSFDTKESAWRATEKWLTYKPVVTVVKFGAIYLWTGSATSMLALGTILGVATTGVFYANNLGWDLYEWSQSSPVPVPVAMR